MCSFTLAYSTTTGGPGANDGSTVIFRRPANTTNRIAGATVPANLHSAYDVGTFSTTGSPSEHAMYFSQNTAAAFNTTLRGGNQTGMLYHRIL